MVRQVGSEKKLEDELGMSMRKIRNRFREQIEERALVENLKNKKIATISVGRGEIEEFYQTMKDSLPRVEESVNLSHILVSVGAGGDAREKALAKIKEVQQKPRSDKYLISSKQSLVFISSSWKIGLGRKYAPAIFWYRSR